MRLKSLKIQKFNKKRILKNFIFTYEIFNHGSKTSATYFDHSAFGIVLMQHVVPVSTS